MSLRDDELETRGRPAAARSARRDRARDRRRRPRPAPRARVDRRRRARRRRLGASDEEGGDAWLRATSVLLRRYHEHGDLQAREQLIEQYMSLVRSLARRYSYRGEQLDDLVQIGSIGLIKAIDRFDLEPRRRADDVRDTEHHRRDQAPLPRPRLGRARAARPAGAERAALEARRAAHRAVRALADDPRARRGGRASRRRTCSRRSSPAARTRRSRSRQAAAPRTARRSIRSSRSARSSTEYEVSEDRAVLAPGLQGARRARADDPAPALLRGADAVADRPAGRDLADARLAADPPGAREDPRRDRRRRVRPRTRRLIETVDRWRRPRVAGTRSVATCSSSTSATTTLAVHEWGSNDGRPLFFWHALGPDASADVLRAGRRAARGRPDAVSWPSTAPASERRPCSSEDGYALDSLVELVQRLVGDVSSSLPLVVMGHSWGGAIAVRYAAAHPESVDRARAASTAGTSTTADLPGVGRRPPCRRSGSRQVRKRDGNLARRRAAGRCTAWQRASAMRGRRSRSARVPTLLVLATLRRRMSSRTASTSGASRRRCRRPRCAGRRTRAHGIVDDVGPPLGRRDRRAGSQTHGDQ